MNQEEALTVMSAFTMMREIMSGQEVTPLKLTIIDSARQIVQSYVGNNTITLTEKDAQGVLTVRGTPEMFLESENNE